MAELSAHLAEAERALFAAVDRAASQIGVAVGVVRVDVQPWLVLHASEMFERSFGRPASEILDKPPWEMLVPEDRERVRALAASRGPGAPPITIEGTVVRADGMRRSIEVGVARMTTPSAELAVCFLRDVTDERAAIDGLRQSETRFRSLIESAPDGVVILQRGRIALANPVAARLLANATPDELHGRFVAEFLPPEDAARAAERVARIVAGEMLGASEYRVNVDRERSVEIHSIPVQWEGGPALLAFARDVTERRRMQQELDRASRLAAVGTMAAAVAHEINNPLTYIQLSLQRLERELSRVGSGIPSGAREHVTNALHGTERVAAIVRDLRGFSREDDVAVRAVDVVAVVDAALRMVEHDLKHRAKLVRRVAPDVPTVEAVSSRLEQVVVNLLINAIQALPAGDPTRDEITVEVWAGRGTPGTVSIVVRDTGIGIAAEDRERVFEPFFTTKPAGEGTGLGLAVCKRIVDAMGGTIAIGPGPGGGSRGGTEVTVTLPAVAAVTRAPVTEVTAAASGRLRILVIDDEPLIRKLLLMALSQHHEVEAVPGGEAALATLASTPRPFDVILCDVMMPGMNGREVHDRIRATYPGLERRIVLVTGGAFAPRLADFLDHVDNPKLYKPFSEADVLGAVAAAAAR
jgi:PAS domain S-box-containing protein